MTTALDDVTKTLRDLAEFEPPTDRYMLRVRYEYNGDVEEAILCEAGQPYDYVELADAASGGARFMAKDHEYWLLLDSWGDSTDEGFRTCVPLGYKILRVVEVEG